MLKLEHDVVVIKPSSSMQKHRGKWVEVAVFKYHYRATLGGHIICTAGVPAITLESARMGADKLAGEMETVVEERL